MYKAANGLNKGMSKRYCDMSNEDLLKETRKLASTVNQQKHDIFLKDCTIARLSSRKCQLKTKINQLCKEGNFGPVIFRLKSAADQGYFSDKKVLESLIMSVAHNAHAQSPQGFRYEDCLKTFCAMVYLKGSRSISKFVSDSINGPSLDTVEALIRERRVALKPAFSKYNFIAARQTIELAEKMHKVTGPVPTLMAEDETGIQANQNYLEESDTIIGFCGPMTEDPKKPSLSSRFRDKSW